MSSPSPRENKTPARTFATVDDATAYLLELSAFTRKLYKRTRASLLAEVQGHHQWLEGHGPEKWNKEELIMQLIVDAYPWAEQNEARRVRYGT